MPTVQIADTRGFRTRQVGKPQWIVADNAVIPLREWECVESKTGYQRPCRLILCVNQGMDRVAELFEFFLSWL